MSPSWTRPLRFILSISALFSLAVLAACGGSSDSTNDGDSASSGGGDTKLSLVAYAVPKVGFDKVIPPFQKTDAGKGVTFSQSYGASGDQSRKVESGLPTDVVNFSRRARRHPPGEGRPGRRGLELRTSTRASRSARS